MYDVKLGHLSRVDGDEQETSVTARHIVQYAIPAGSDCEVASTSQRNVSAELQTSYPPAECVLAKSQLLSHESVAPVERVSALSTVEQRRTTKCAKYHSPQLRNEGSDAFAHSQVTSSSSSLPINAAGHSMRYYAVERHTVAATSASNWLPYVLRTAHGYTLREEGRATVTGAATDTVFLSGTNVPPLRPRACRPSGTPGTSTCPPAVGPTSATAGEKCTSRTSAWISSHTDSSHGISRSNASLSGSSTERNACVAKSRVRASGLAIHSYCTTADNTSSGTAKQTDDDAPVYSTCMKHRGDGGRQNVQWPAHEETLPRLSSLPPSSARCIPSKVSNGAADVSLFSTPTTAALGKTGLRKTASLPLTMLTDSQQPHEKLKIRHDKEHQQHSQSAPKQQTLCIEQRGEPRDVEKQCIPDIRAPALQHGTVLFCSYCAKRLVKRKHYMQSWPEFLLCDACVLLPPCHVCHRKALPAYIALQYTSGSCRVSKGNTTIKRSTTECSSNLQSTCSASSSQSRRTINSTTCGATDNPSRDSSTLSCPTSSSDIGGGQGTKCTSNAANSCSGTSVAPAGRSRKRPQGARIRCEPLHDAEGLRLCGHCALLNPVNTKECLTRITQYALLWLRVRHGVDFTNARLSVQRAPLVQQRLHKNLLLHDLLLSASTPESVRHLHTPLQSHEPHNLQMQSRGKETLESRSTTKFRPDRAARRLRIDPAEGIRPAPVQQCPTEALTLHADGGVAPTTPEAVRADEEKMSPSAHEMELVVESLQNLRLRPPQLLHPPKRLHTGDDLRPELRQQNCDVAPRQQTTQRPENYNEEHDKQARMQKMQTQRQGEQIPSMGEHEQQQLSMGGLGFAIEAVGYSELNGGTKSGVFGRCEVEQLPIDELIPSLHLPSTRDEQRHALQRAVQVSCSDTHAAASANVSGVALRPESSKAEQTRQNHQAQCTHETLRRSLRCVRRVAVLRSLPETLFVSHLIHELIHAYIWCGQLPVETALHLQVEEGICNAVAASFLRERLQELVAWEAELAEATAAAREDAAVVRGREGTAAQGAAAPKTASGEPSETRARSEAVAAVAEGEAPRDYLAAGSAGTAAPNAHTGARVKGEGSEESQQETDGVTEHRRELLLLLVRHEARIIRTRLDEMETDKHCCYGEGYRVMRRIMQDLQLQQTLYVATCHGYSLESMERAAASLCSRKASNKNTGTPAPPVGSGTASNNTVSSAGDIVVQREVPQQTLGHCGAAGPTPHIAVAATHSECNGKTKTSGDAEQTQRHRQENRSARSTHTFTAEVHSSALQQPVHRNGKQTRERQEKVQEQGPFMPARRTGQGSLALTGAHPLWSTKRPTSAGTDPLTAAAALKLKTSAVAAQLVGAVTTWCLHRTASAGSEGLQRYATAYSVVTRSG